jgi:hypothetical protein
MRLKAAMSVLTVVCACSSTPATVATSDAGDGGGGGEAGGGGDGGCSSNKPQTTAGGSCTEPGFVPAEAGAVTVPPILCIDYSGSEQVPADTQMSCTTMHTTFSMSTCAVANAGQTVVGYCLQKCGSPLETVQYYYATGATVGKQQCLALGNVWVAM